MRELCAADVLTVVKDKAECTLQHTIKKKIAANGQSTAKQCQKKLKGHCVSRGRVDFPLTERFKFQILFWGKALNSKLLPMGLTVTCMAAFTH